MISLILADTSKQLSSFSVAVLLMVVLLIVLTFFALFHFCYRYYSKCIVNGLEDEGIKKQLINKNRKYFENLWALQTNSAINSQEKLKNLQTLSAFIKAKSKSGIKKIKKIVTSVAVTIMYIVLISVLIISIVVNIKGNLFYLGNSANLIIVTNSMETVYEGNTYIKENNLTDQIPTNAFISLNKVTNESEIKLYDIVAFKSNDGRMIVHRIINIYEVNGVTKYDCRGDANNESAGFEKGLVVGDFIGKYDGFQSYLLGIILTYLRSGIGIITIMFAFITISLYEGQDSKTKKIMKQRENFLVLRIDEKIKEDIVTGRYFDYLAYANEDSCKIRKTNKNIQKTTKLDKKQQKQTKKEENIQKHTKDTKTKKTTTTNEED